MRNSALPPWRWLGEILLLGCLLHPYINSTFIIYSIIYISIDSQVFHIWGYNLILLYTSWSFLMVQIVKSLPAMQETRVQSLGCGDPLEKEMATHSWMENPMDGGAWQTIVHEVAKSISWVYFTYLEIYKEDTLYILLIDVHIWPLIAFFSWLLYPFDISS